jgi:hypothetical protein
MRVFFCMAGVFLAATALSAVLAADPPAADDAAIKKLIADMADKSQAVRDAAEKRLIEIGIPTRPALLEAARGPDPEIRMRAQRALESLVEATLKDLGPVPEDPTPMMFSPNGEHAAYWLREGNTVRLVVDSKAGPPWTDALTASPPPPLTRDGLLAYRGEKDGRHYVVVVGREDKAIEVPNLKGCPILSPDGKHAAWCIDKGDQTVVVLDGIEGPLYKTVEYLTFLPDGRLYYVAKNKALRSLVTVGEKVLGPYLAARAITSSPDGKRFAFTVMTAPGRHAMVLDGVEGAEYPNLGDRICFSPDSRSLVYSVVKDKAVNSCYVVNDKEFTLDGRGWTADFSPDGKQLVYYVAGGLMRLDLATGKSFRVPTPEGKHCVLPVFSPDGDHVAVVVSADPLRWAIDGKYIQQPFKGDCVNDVADILRSCPLSFSADGRHVFVRGVHIYPGNKYKRFMIIDGEARPEHDDLWIPDDFAQYPKSLRYVVRDGKSLRLVETYWPEDMTWEKAAKN